MFNQVIKYGGECETFSGMFHQPVAEDDRQGRIERCVLRIHVQGQSPTLIELHRFCRLPIRHAQDKLEHEHAKETHGIPCWASIVYTIERTEPVTIRFQQWKDRASEKNEKVRPAANRQRNTLRLFKERRNSLIGLGGW
jgi:hypothetical protein